MIRSLLIIACLWQTACTRPLDPETYRYDRSSESTQACIQQCQLARAHCEGEVARVFQRCLKRHPGVSLDQQQCFERRQAEVLAALPEPLGGRTCHDRFDACFERACGGVITEQE